MDTAFKRRFDWRYVSTDPITDSSNPDDFINNPKIFVYHNTNQVATCWVELYQAINSYILSGDSALGVNEDKQVGQFFIQFDDSLIAESYEVDEPIEAISSLIINKLLMYLWEDVEGRNSIMGSSVKRLFLSTITSYGELNKLAPNRQVFSDYFLEEYLGIR